ncbi:MAG: 2,3-bisphosphoglycerate-independent phosphoglycerate mutase [Candidatus Omnitrophica bacterium]|nr:2,3-bisphosphoglycerate-independent phosphoglycerate mutase [Candidatus Omnitrophota bacterium]
MKYILIVLSGVSDHPIEELEGKTPLEVSKVPNLQFFAKLGKVGQAKPLDDNADGSSEAAFLATLGYDPKQNYRGPGPLEAANLEVKMESNEVAFRLNFITEFNGVLADPTAGHISTKEARALVTHLNKKLASDFVRFFPGNNYRHIAVLKDSHGFNALSAKTFAAEEVTGKPIQAHLPKGPGEELLKKLMYDAKLLLQDHEINQVRLDLAENPANMIWLSGQGASLALEKFSDKFGLSGAMIAGIEYAKGIGRLAGLTILEVSGATGDLETNYEKKGKALLEALQEKDFVCVHVRACEEASCQGNLKAKISALEGIDFFILSKAKEYYEKNHETRILITGTQTFATQMRRAVRDSIPFVLAGKNVMADENDRMTEQVAKSSPFQANKRTELTHLLLSRKESI